MKIPTFLMHEIEKRIKLLLSVRMFPKRSKELFDMAWQPVYKIILLAYNVIVMGSYIGFIPLILTFRLLHLWSLSEGLLNKMATFWAHNFLRLSGVHFRVLGKENLPSHNRVCFVSNHQSYYDIPLIITSIERMTGFIAKKELAKVPFLNLWLWVTDCPLIDRKDSRGSLTIIKKRIRRINKERSMLIFPEGTRSKSQRMNSFKYGGLSVFMDEGLTLQPITVVDTYRIFEGAGGRVQPADISLYIHPAIEVPKGLTEKEKHDLLANLECIINPERVKKESVVRLETKIV